MSSPTQPDEAAVERARQAVRSLDCGRAGAKSCDRRAEQDGPNSYCWCRTLATAALQAASPPDVVAERDALAKRVAELEAEVVRLTKALWSAETYARNGVKDECVTDWRPGVIGDAIAALHKEAAP